MLELIKYLVGINCHSSAFRRSRSHMILFSRWDLCVLLLLYRVLFAANVIWTKFCSVLLFLCLESKDELTNSSDVIDRSWSKNATMKIWQSLLFLCFDSKSELYINRNTDVRTLVFYPHQMEVSVIHKRNFTGTLEIQKWNLNGR